MPAGQSPAPAATAHNRIIENIGNAALTEAALTVGANFQQAPGSGAPADCASSFTLAPGGSCNLSISFTPTVRGALQTSALGANYCAGADTYSILME
jgi:hypothetical protein